MNIRTQNIMLEYIYDLIVVLLLPMPMLLLYITVAIFAVAATAAYSFFKYQITNGDDIDSSVMMT